MIIKKFQGKTEAEATELAKKELGDAVVIMNVRSVKKKGLLGFFSQPVSEVTVALEEEPQRAAVPKRETTQPAAADGIQKDAPIAAAWQGQTRGLYDKGAAPHIGAIEEKLDSLQSLLAQQIKTSETEKAAVKEEESLPEKEAVPEKDAELERFMKLLNNVMAENEVDGKYRKQIMEEIEKGQKPNTPFDYALAVTYQKLILKFGKAAEITPAEKGPKVVFFVGPTGVGKTTTIAKVASRFRVEEKKQVALLTADTYRIAAAEQLRTYANILEVPFRVIYTMEELENALKDFKEYDYIFVDTTGHSHQNQAQKDAMTALVSCVDGLVEKEVYLVMSATTKYRDLLSIADSYKDMADYRLIFTKLDETVAYGNLLNLKLYTGASMSYVTYGQNVPDDIEVFNPQKTVKKLLGGKA